jgi:DNA-binding MarR family transcriptional regulator
MFTNLTTTLRDSAYAIYAAFVWPGKFLLALTVVHAPGLSEWLNIDNGESPVLMTFILSLVSWFLVIAFVTFGLRIGRNVTRTLGAIFRTGLFRMSLYLRGLKTALVLWLRDKFPKRKTSDLDTIPMVEFDDLDMAVLRSASAIGPGLALAAPDLAGHFKLRPSQVQRSLKKLGKNKMLTQVIGSTDGYGNYRLTDSGTAYLAMWQRQTAGT